VTLGAGKHLDSVGPAHFKPAHGVNAGRDTSDMASSSKGAWGQCVRARPHVGPHDTRGLQ